MATTDEMENAWGVDLVVVDRETRRLPDKTINQFQFLVMQSVPGFQLASIVESGTSANAEAVRLSTQDENGRCLFAMGNYVGGKDRMYQYSSAKHSAGKQLSVPTLPDELEYEDSKYQIVALPYHVQCDKFNDEDVRQFELLCLKALNRKLFVAQIGGVPFRAILLELISCGTGGELSEYFLAAMGKLCRQYDISIIVDEVMTGGRVGPNMTMSPTTPDDFTNQIEFVTMGKFMGCGLVLKRTPSRPMPLDSNRGISTHASPSEAYRAWDMAIRQLRLGTVARRRKEVLDKMDSEKLENNWGKGLLIFTSRSRPGSKKGLKNRHLPMLANTKIRNGGTKETSWNRSTVCDNLMDAGYAWMEAMAECDTQRFSFVDQVSRLVLGTEVQNLTAEAVLEFVGETTAETLAEKEREKRQKEAAARGGKCAKRAKTFIQEALGEINVNAAAMITRTRVGSGRRTVYKVDRSKLAKF